MESPHRLVVLLHELSGESHHDWMFERPGDAGEHRLVSFRTDGPLPPFSASWMLNMKRTGDHRAAYLDHEGPVSGDRGEVSRVATGVVVRLEETREKVVIDGVIGLADGEQKFGAVFTRLPDDRWRCRWTPLQPDRQV